MNGKHHTEQKQGMYVWKVRVCSQNHLDAWLGDYLGGLDIWNDADGTSVLTGKLPDLPAVYGMIMRLRDGGIVLLSLHVEREQNRKEEVHHD